MRLPFPVLCVSALLAACSQPSTPAAAPARATTAASAAAPAPAPPRSDVWFICDGVDAPTIVLFGDSPDDRRVQISQYDKRTGARSFTGAATLGDGDGAAGSVYTPVLLNGAEAGHVRQINPGVLETPGAAYTLPYTSVQFRGADLQCRWLPRTRLAGFTQRRSIVVHEDADGDLIYTSFNFNDAGAAHAVDLSENGRSTPFSAEIRGGEEALGPTGADFTFAGPDGYTYAVHAGSDGAGRIDVLRNGQRVQSEALIAFQLGEARQP